MDFKQQLNALILFHLDKYVSGCHLLHILEEDALAREIVGTPDAIAKSTLLERINTRGLDQLSYLFGELYKSAAKVLPKDHINLAQLVGIDGFLINATLSMCWADYRKNDRKAKVYFGLDLNQSILR